MSFLSDLKVIITLITCLKNIKILHSIKFVGFYGFFFWTVKNIYLQQKSSKYFDLIYKWSFIMKGKIKMNILPKIFSFSLLSTNLNRSFDKKITTADNS